MNVQIAGRALIQILSAQSAQTRACSELAERHAQQVEDCSRVQVELTQLQTVLQGYLYDLQKQFQDVTDIDQVESPIVTLNNATCNEVSKAHGYGFCQLPPMISLPIEGFQLLSPVNLDRLTQLNSEVEAAGQLLTFLSQDCDGLLQSANQIYQQWLQWIQRITQAQNELQAQFFRKI